MLFEQLCALHIGGPVFTTGSSQFQWKVFGSCHGLLGGFCMVLDGLAPECRGEAPKVLIARNATELVLGGQDWLGLSHRLVEARQRDSAPGTPIRVTVNDFVSPSRMLAEALG